ncbi:hypothetical protein ACF0H5_000023 [Mactra antiquata]
MAAEEVYIGTWRIVECVSLAGTVETTGIEGTEFVLDEGGDVAWKVAEDAEPLPFFNCEAYEVVPDKSYGQKAIKFIGTYAGLEVHFKVEISDDLMLLTYERCCMLQCQKVSSPDPKDDVPYSFLGALDESYFHDVVITAENGKEFKVHSTVLGLSTPAIDWTKSHTMLTGLPEDVLHSTLHYMYAESLPSGMSEDTARNCVKMMSKVPELGAFVQLCDTFLENTALKQQITSLVTDMHSSASRIIDMFSGACSSDSSTPSQQNPSDIVKNPAKLCYIIQQCLREAAVAFSKLLVLCDLFSRRKSELSREERHEIIKYAKSRIPIFCKQWDQFLEVCKTHLSSLSYHERREIASYLVPEIETALDVFTTYIIDSKAVLEKIISGSESEKSEKSEKSKKGNVGDMLGKTLKNALHLRELKKLKKLHEKSSSSFFHFMQKKETFCQTAQAGKVRDIARILESLGDMVTVAQFKAMELLVDIDVRLTWRDWKYIFKLSTSKISWAICKALSNKTTVQPLVKQACDMVNKEQFTASVTSLGLLDTDSKTSPSDSCTSKPSSSSNQPNRKTKYIQLSSVESLCKPPNARDCRMAKQALKLFHSQKQTDLIFEIVVTQDNGDTVIDHTGEEPVESTDTSKDVEIFEVPAHRVVIAARCDWFRCALLSGMKESIDRKITVHDTNPKLFESFLEYLYCGQLEMSDFTTEQIADMMTLADRYDTVSLRGKCEYTLKHRIDDDTVFYLLSFADQINAKTLKDSCKSYIGEHPVLTSCDVFQDLPEQLQLEVEALTLTSGLHSSDSPSSVSSTSEMEEMMDRMNIDSCMTSSSSEDMFPGPESGRLQECIDAMTDIVGNTIPHEELLRAALAADCDANRAINFLYS